MFDKTYITPQSGHSNVNVSVQEIRAPTDDSVRLLREVEESVQKKIVDSMRLDNNFLKAQIVFNHAIHNHGYDVICHFKLNDETYMATYFAKYKDDPQNIAKGVCESIASAIYDGPIVKILVQAIAQSELLKSGT